MECLFKITNDEIVVDITDMSEPEQKLIVYQISIGMNNIGYPLKTELLTLHKINGTDGYCKIISTENGEEDIEFKCLDNYMFPFVLRKFVGEEVSDSDKTFYHEGLLSRFIEVPKIEVNLQWILK